MHGDSTEEHCTDRQRNAATTFPLHHHNQLHPNQHHHSPNTQPPHTTTSVHPLPHPRLSPPPTSDLSELFEGPNLCGLHAEGPVRLDGARHQAFLALTEEGVEAGAATATIFSRSFPAFSATRPFVLLLWSDKANMPLFMGRVTQP